MNNTTLLIHFWKIKSTLKVLDLDTFFSNLKNLKEFLFYFDLFIKPKVSKQKKFSSIKLHKDSHTRLCLFCLVNHVSWLFRSHEILCPSFFFQLNLFKNSWQGFKMKFVKVKVNKFIRNINPFLWSNQTRWKTNWKVVIVIPFWQCC